MQYRNSYYFSGAIEHIYPMRERIYKDKTHYEREALIVNKYQKRGKWIVSRALFVFKDDAATALSHFIPRKEVIVSFSIKGIKYVKNNEDRFFQKLEAYGIMSPKDKMMSEKWMAAENWDDVNPMNKDDVDSSMKLSEEEELKRRPVEKDYDASSFEPKLDYSDTVRKKKVELPPIPPPEDSGDLPF